MPIAKKRADLAELISVAAVHRKKIAKRQRRLHSIFRIKRALSSNESGSIRKNTLKKTVRSVLDSLSHRLSRSDTLTPEGEEAAPPVESESSNGLALYASAHIHYFLEHIAVRVVRLVIIVLAFLTLSLEAAGSSRGRCSNNDICRGTDILIDIFFIAEGALKFLAFYAHMDMHKVFNFKTNGFVVFLRRSGISDIIIASASLVLARRNAGDWFRLLRVLLISSFALEEVPHLEVLLVSQ